MSNTAGRLLNLLSLLQTRREWPGSALAERLRVSPRTVRRDVERLRELGYPVQATMGAAGGYRLVAGAAMPPLLLDDEEAVAIAVGLRTAAGQAIGGIEEASLRALAKLEQILPSRLRYRVRTLSAATVPLLFEHGPAVDPETLTALAAAAANRERVRFLYRSGDGAESRRLVEPHRLVAAGRRWYLVAYDADRADWRIFRVDRITQPHATGQRVPPRELPEPNAAAFVTARMYDLAPTFRALVTLHTPADAVSAYAPGEVEPIDAHTSRLLTHEDTLPWLAFRLSLLDCAFVVHEPPELIAYLRTLGTRFTHAAGGPV